GGDQLRHRREEHGDEKQRAGDQGGKTGAAALGDAGGGLHEGGDGGGTADGAHAGGDGVGHHGLVHVGHFAFFREHIAGGAGAVEGAQGVEHIDHAEGQHGGDEHDDEAAHAVGGDIGREVKAVLEDPQEG